MHLGATELFHSVTPTGSCYIYSRVKFWKIFQNLRLRIACSAFSRLGIILLAASDLPSLVSAAVNGILPRRCRRSKFTAELGYELETLCYP